MKKIGIVQRESFRDSDLCICLLLGIVGLGRGGGWGLYKLILICTALFILQIWLVPNKIMKKIVPLGKLTYNFKNVALSITQSCLSRLKFSLHCAKLNVC